MKQKNAIVVLLLIGLFSASTISTAFTTHTVEYPAYVPLGETIDVNIIFSYAVEEDCLYGQYVWLQWMVNNETTTNTWTYGSREYIYNLDNYPRISNVIFSYDTLVMYYGNLAVDDVFTFKMYYYSGYDWGDKITYAGIQRTDTFEIIIGEPPTTEKTNGFSVIFAPLLILSLALMVTKRKKGEIK